MDDNPIEIEWTELIKSVRGLKTDASNKISIKREVIPIIFVPGIMGSRLKRKGGSCVWDPDDMPMMLRLYGLMTADAADKKDLLIGPMFDSRYLEVDKENWWKLKGLTSDDDTRMATVEAATRRGWGGISWRSYGDFILRLHGTAWPEPIRHCFELPVHAFGYNWTDSCMTSGRALAKEIKEVIGRYQDSGQTCKRVVLVTHSMGGLVARYACMRNNEEMCSKVLGVVHTVQPVLGSGAAYWRMKAGIDRRGGNHWYRLDQYIVDALGAWVLGTDGKEVTALLGNMPGGLELLPNKLYGPGWLKLEHGKEQKTYPLSDPYEEIYREKDEFWRLVNPAHLDPDSNFVKTLFPERRFTEPMRRENDQIAWLDYLSTMGWVERFHDTLGLYQHPCTYNIYGKGEGRTTKTARNCVFRLEPFLWKQRWITAGEMGPQLILYKVPFTPDPAVLKLKGTTSGATNPVIESLMSQQPRRFNGGFVEYVPYGDDAALEVVLQAPGDPGDGTVPIESGMALVEEGLGKYCASDLEHEPAYKSKVVQDKAIRAIENLCRAEIRRAIEG